MKTRLIYFWKNYKSPIRIFTAYAILTKVSNTLLLTATTSFVLFAGKSGLELPSIVHEISSQYSLIVYALAATLAASTLYIADRALQKPSVFWTPPSKKIWELERLSKRELWRGASSGLLAIFVLVVILYATKQISFLGLFITSTIGTPVFPLFISDAISLLLLIGAEEFLFRHKILFKLQSKIPTLHANVITSGAYILVKCLQFDLVWLDICNLFLLNMILGFYYFKNQRAHRGIGFLVVLFGFTHIFVGMPLWQHSSPSVFLFKASTKASIYLTGGESGALASLGILSIFIFLAISSYLSWKQEN